MWRFKATLTARGLSYQCQVAGWPPECLSCENGKQDILIGKGSSKREREEGPPAGDGWARARRGGAHMETAGLQETSEDQRATRRASGARARAATTQYCLNRAESGNASSRSLERLCRVVVGAPLLLKRSMDVQFNNAPVCGSFAAPRPHLFKGAVPTPPTR